MKKNDVIERLENMPEDRVVELWDAYCNASNYYDEYIYYMDVFDELFYGKSPLELAHLVEGQDFKTYDDWFRVTIWGVASTSTPLLFIDEEALADYIIENEITL